MGVLAEIFNLISRKCGDIKAGCIFYKIVDSIERNQFALQCINTTTVFHISIVDLVYDTDILHGLHPVQACFIGIEYAKILKKNQKSIKKNKSHSSSATYRYGRYFLNYQDRYGNIAFTDSVTQKDFLMDPRDIALSEELIGEFDAAQAFYIGLCTGLKMKNPPKSVISPQKYPHLRLVKG